MPDNENQVFIDFAGRYPLDGYSLRKIFTDITKIHFSNPGNFGKLKDEMNKYVYDKDKPSSSRVKIQSGHTYSTSEENAYPLISVDIGDISYSRVAIGDRSPAGDTSYAQQAQTSLRIHHLSQNVDEAWALASLTSAFYFGFSKFIRDRLNLMDFSPKSTTEPQLISDSNSPNKIYRSVFAGIITYDYGWTMDVEGHTIRRTSIKTVLEMQ